MKMRRKKFLSAFICLALAFTLLPTVAMADAVTHEDIPVQAYTLYYKNGNLYSNKDCTIQVTDLEGWSGSGSTLTLTNFHFTTTARNALELPAGTTLVLIGTNTVTSGTGSENSNGIYVYGNLTVSSASTGSLTVTGGTATDDKKSSIGICANYNGNITVEGGTLIGKGGTSNHESYGVLAYNNINVSGSGVLTGEGGAAGNSYGVCAVSSIDVSGTGILTGEGGEATGNSYGVCAGNSITVDGTGSLTATGGSLEASGNTSALNKRPSLNSLGNYKYKTNTAASEPEGAYTRSRITEFKHSPTVRYFTILPDYSVAGIGDETISGVVNTAITSRTITIELQNDTFKAITAGAITWIANLPAGLTQSVTEVAAEATSAAITISGTPTAPSYAQLEIVIPADALASNANLTVTSNASAVYAIIPAAPAADFAVTQPATSDGKGKVEVVSGKTASDYEYRIMVGETWPDMWINLGATPLSDIEAPATIELRIAETASPRIPASASYTVTITEYTPHNSSATSTVPVIVDGETYNIGKAKTSGGITTVTIDQTELQKQLDSASETVVIPVAPGRGADTVAAKLVVANVDEMAEKEMTLSVQVNDVSYMMPAVAIGTDALMKELGATDPTKVPVNVTIRGLSEDDVELENGELMLPPVEFKVTASYGGNSTEVDTFERFVQRVIEIPEGVDASKITTAVVVENGKQRHVPTEIFQKDGKWYAKINSLTNSTYALIHNEASFTDADGKWFEAVVTEMASRGVIDGRNENTFDGEANITRAEFAAILVRALGLPTDGTYSFSDVKTGDWYYGAVGTAVEYGLINGYEDNTFRPNANITRQEAMAMVRRAAKVAEYAGTTGALTSFSDASGVSSWAQTAAEFNVGSGLIKGNDGELRPTDSITRAESAVVILRLLQRAELVDVRTDV